MLDIRASDGGDQNADIDHPRRRYHSQNYQPYACSLFCLVSLAAGRIANDCLPCIHVAAALQKIQNRVPQEVPAFFALPVRRWPLPGGGQKRAGTTTADADADAFTDVR